MRWIGLGLIATAAISPDMGGQTTAGTPPMVVFADNASPTASLWRAWGGSSWTPAASAGSGGATPAFHELAVCSDWVRMALLRIDTDNRVRLARWDGAAWGAPVTLTNNCGSHATKVAAAAYEHDSRELLVVYRDGWSGLSWRSYTQEDPPEHSLWLGFLGPMEWITLRPCPGSDRILLLVSASDRLYAAVWDGSEFTSITALELDLEPGVRPFDGAFMTASRRAVVAWGTDDGAVRSRVWTGSGWGATATLPALGASARWITLAASPEADSDDVLLATLDDQRDVNLSRWNGASWGAFTEVETDAGAADGRLVDLAYQPGGARALAAWRRTGESRVRYRSWNGLSWSSTLSGPDLGSQPQGIVLGPGREDDQVLMAVRRRGAGTLLDYLTYTQNGDLDVSGVTFEGPTGERIAGVTLPAPPAGASNSNDLFYGNSATVNLAPGVYGAVTANNNLTLNMSAGTYIFRRLDVHNNLTLNLNTTNGDITVILDNGDLHAVNNAEILNTGDGRAVFHVKNGNVDIKNNADVVNADFYVYSGGIGVGNNAEIRGTLYATQDISIGSGTVTMPAYFTGGPGSVSAVVWTGGVPGPAATLTTAAPGGTGAVAVGERPPFLRPRVTLWREIDPATP